MTAVPSRFLRPRQMNLPVWIGVRVAESRPRGRGARASGSGFEILKELDVYPAATVDVGGEAHRALAARADHQVGSREGLPGKLWAQLMGHAKVDTTLNVYTQVIDGALRPAVKKVGSEFSNRSQSRNGHGAKSSM
jgi:hypothetical protein